MKRGSGRQPDCPCGSGVPYSTCCARYLEHDAQPATAEQLMRSRYTAYVLKREDYVLRTWHPSTRPADLDVRDASVKWAGLEIVRIEAGGVEDDAGEVEFVARYKIGGRAERLRERSRFVREGGCWSYLGADLDSSE